MPKKRKLPQLTKGNGGRKKGSTQLVQLNRLRKTKNLKSDLVRGATDRTLNKYLRKCCIVIHNKYFHDDLKAPLHNDAKPAKVSRASFNAYFGINKKSKIVRWKELHVALGQAAQALGWILKQNMRVSCSRK